MKKIITALLIFPLFISGLRAQTEEKKTEPVNYTYQTFRSLRNVNSHNVETLPSGVMHYWIQHRFGLLNSGIDDLFGLDLGASMRLGVDYGVLNNLMVSLGRANTGKTYDASAQYKFLHQCSGGKNMPVTATFLSRVAINTLSYPQAGDPRGMFTSRMQYTFQLMVARKFGEKFSVQLSPTMIHRNLVPTAQDQNDIFAIGLSARYRVTYNIALCMDYYYQLPGYNADNNRNPLSLSMDYETNGHVFSFVLSNSFALTDNYFISGSPFNKNEDWSKGRILFGFNISRSFKIHRPIGG
ncbi:MAG: hypothetical protein K1X92_00375 [Bacteroidia bacterium]|nr:hypothetical protein [Bacteroidia bacterium]